MQPDGAHPEFPDLPDLPGAEPHFREGGPADVALTELAPGTEPAGEGARIDLLLDIAVQVSVELGRARMSIGEVLALRANSVIELDKLAGEPADIFINGTRIARGEVVVVDEKFGVRVLEVVSRATRLAMVD